LGVQSVSGDVAQIVILFACDDAAVPCASPGGGSDVLARLMAEHIGRAQGVTVMVENRPGASTAIGTEAVARAAPDGSTLLILLRHERFRRGHLWI
jgi:tripartite-type tricarboxylate transporter receptor subunit TctC